MRRSFLQPNATLSDQAYVELVRSLFVSVLPSAVMSALFVGVAALAVWTSGDAMLVVLGVVGTALSILRLVVVTTCRSTGIERSINDRLSAKRHERAFAFSYAAFALLLGLFAARVTALDHTGVHMVVAALLVGYAAGVAAVVSLRPRIGALSMLAAVAPFTLACLWRAETFHVTLAVVLLGLLGGGLQNMQARYRAEVDKIEMRRTISGLARLDHLTGLPNRLGLAERYEEVTMAHAPGCLIAVHCLDLDRFKPVNDRYGHPAGDQLLRMVADRLSCALRNGDLAARIGGDEFIVLQSGMRHPDEAELLARRLIKTLSEPYSLGEDSIYVGASIGYDVSSCGDSLESSISRADNALYAIKEIGGGSAAAHRDAYISKSVARLG